MLKEIARKNNLKQNGDTDPQPTEPKVVTPQVSVAPVVEKKTFSSDDFVDVPVSLDPEYVAVSNLYLICVQKSLLFYI